MKTKGLGAADSTALRCLMVCGVWCIGLFLSFRATLWSGFAFIQGGPIDSRLNNFVLEHGYRWVAGWSGHQELLTPELLLASKRIFGFTDIMLGIAPFFWIWRSLGFDAETSYQLWMISLSSLNFLICFLLLRRCFGVGLSGASLASLLFAFNTAQTSKVMHQQLVPQFYVLLGIMALFWVFNETSPRRTRCAAIILFFLSWLGQFYSSFYNFILLGLPFGVALIWALAIPSWRHKLFGVIREHYLCILFAGLVSLALAWPILSEYLSRLDRFGYYEQPIVRPKIYVWFLTSRDNLLYGWIRNGPFSYLKGAQFSQGVGFVTSAAAVAGIFLYRKNRSVQVVAAALATVVLITTYWTNSISAWSYLREIIPGAKALRASGRIGMVQLIPTAIGVALLFDWLKRRRMLAVLVLIATICIVEQVNIGGRTMSKQALQREVAGISGQVDPDASAFLLVPKIWRDDLAELAAWVALTSNKPTLNARYLNYRLFSAHADRTLEDFLKRLRQEGLENVQLIEVGPRSAYQ